MGKIQDDNWLYSFLRIFVDHHTFRGFRRYRIVGRENIPEGACLYGSNHCNTLMDAMVILATTHEKKVFIARADIFQNLKTAKILRWMRILPIYRIRDGIGAVRDKNGDTMDQAMDVMYDEVPMYLFPEATHRTKHSLRPISKGIFHIALGANNKYGKEKPVYIVPVGLEYGDYFRFRSTILLSYGEPINVSEFVKGREEENEAVILNELKTVLRERMAKLISFIPDEDEDYEAIWELTKIRAGKQPCSLKKRLENNNQKIAEILDFKEKEPEKAKTLFDKVRDFTRLRKEKKISVKSVANKATFGKTLLKSLLMLLGLPFYVAAAVVSFPIWIIAYFVLKGLKDKAFRNTANYCVEMVMHPLVMAAGITLLFCLVPWKFAALGSVFLYYSYVYFIDYNEWLRIWMSDIRLIFNGKLKEKAKELF
ncbi:MAG: 1-acyl-sn-glycerol-3-phosphate acyltransferase [Bacteroidales bacterium]|nr:1-acyl-sn-glycerol-3-phosphate acyltransferase [Bacteroidales bacterium]